MPASKLDCFNLNLTNLEEKYQEILKIINYLLITPFTNFETLVS